MKPILLTLSLLALLSFSCSTQQEEKKLPLNQWTYIEIDSTRGKWGDWKEPEWLRYFGLDAGDLNRDGLPDILAGRYFYLNPGGDLTAKWERTMLGANVDGYLIGNFDGDEYAEIIATALPHVYLFEATDVDIEYWEMNKIAEIPATGHVNGQGARLAQIIPGGNPEPMLTSATGIYAADAPQEPDGTWRFYRIVITESDEGFGVGDINDDGLPDIAAATVVDGEPHDIHWWINPGKLNMHWSSYPVGSVLHAADRIEIVDLNGDGRSDIAVSEERYPGTDPDANLFWFEAPEDPTIREWKRHTIFTGYSLNNLDAGDLDNDGDIDLVTNEHKGDLHKLLIFENDGAGNFTEVLADTGKEMHLGAQLFDFDGDGDLDIYGAAWDEYKYLHLWRNDAMKPME